MAEPYSGEHIAQQAHADLRFVGEINPFFHLEIPDEVRKRFAELDKLPPPILLNTQEYFDWRLMGGVTPAKDQGQCGSCWAFASTGAFESAILIADGVMWDLSEQQVLSCNAEGYNCNGGWMDGGWNLFMGYGAIEESNMPYQADDSVPCTQENYNPVAFLHGFEDVPSSINAIKNALMSGPVTTTYLHTSDFHYDCYWQDPSDYLNHVVVIVGWDDNMCDGHGAWIVKNSLGPGHGDNGFDYIPYNSCGIGSYTQLPIYYGGIPELFYVPSSIAIEIPHGQTVAEYMDVFNLGEGNLFYFLRAAHEIEQDSFGYYWYHSDSSAGPPYEWVDISVTGEPINFGYDIDNGNSGPLNLGFNFEFYGNLFNIVNVCTNGWISFTDSLSTQHYSFTLPNPEPPNNMLSPFFYDLNFEYGGEAYFYTNYSDSAIITWQDVFNIIQGGPFTFQIILVAPNYIKFQYDDIEEDIYYRWTVGIESSDGTIGLQVNKYNPYIRDDVAVEFNWAPPPEPLDWISIDSAIGMIAPYNYNQVEITFNAENLDPGTHNAILQLACSDPYNSLNIIPVTVNVGEPTEISEDAERAPHHYSISQCHPNPFNSSTTILYILTEYSKVEIVIFDILGRQVETINEGKKSAGEHLVVWDAENQPSGVYFYRIQTEEYSETKKMMLMR